MAARVAVRLNAASLTYVIHLSLRCCRATESILVIEFLKSESVTTVQRAFRHEYGIAPSDRCSILRWFRKFRDEGCIC